MDSKIDGVEYHTVGILLCMEGDGRREGGKGRKKGVERWKERGRKRGEIKRESIERMDAGKGRESRNEGRNRK